MRFDSGENFSYATNSAAATCSFNLTAAARDILIETITVQSDASNAVVTIQASATTLWAMEIGSGSLPCHFNGLAIESGGANTLSANLTGSAAGGYFAITGKYRWK